MRVSVARRQRRQPSQLLAAAFLALVAIAGTLAALLWQGGETFAVPPVRDGGSQ